MKSLYVTNALLFIIALCLLALASRQWGLMGVANAEAPPVQLIHVVGWNVKQPIPVEVYNPGPPNDPQPLLTKPQPSP